VTGVQTCALPIWSLSPISFLHTGLFCAFEILLYIRRKTVEQTENDFCGIDDEFRDYYRIVCKSYASEIVFRLYVVS